MRELWKNLMSFLGLKDPTSKVLYTEANEKIEKRSWITYFSFIQLTLPGVMFPNFILSAVSYFTADLERNGFSLAFTMW